MSTRQKTRHSTLTLLCMTSVLIWGALQLGAPYVDNTFLLWPSIAWAASAFCSNYLLIRLLEYVVLFLDWLSSRTPTGKGGTSDWASFRSYCKALTRPGAGLFWGLAAQGRRAALFFNFVSNAMCIAPAGSGKGIFTVVNNILAAGFRPSGFFRKAQHAGKVIVDFKGELVCMLKAPLEKRGETVCVLNPAGLWEERIGKSGALNPLDVITDDLTRPGGLRDVTDDTRELNAQMLPEPVKGGGENAYFRDGSRSLMGIAQQIECMIEGYDATLSSVAVLIEDRQRLEDTLRWIAGVDLDGNPHPKGAFPIEQCDWAHHHEPEDLKAFATLLRARASGLLKLMSGVDTRTFDSFITGAQQALAPFAFGALAPAMGRSTINIHDLKKRKTRMSLFLVADASRAELSGKFIGLMSWVILTAMKRHPNKDVPVYMFLDEVTNYFIKGLDSLLTWGRAYGLRLILVFQAISAFEKSYGKDALETLMSETEIKQFLPGQRSPRTLTMIKSLLGERSVMSTAMTRSTDKSGLQENQSESARPLMTEDEIRRMDKGILLVRQHRPILFDPVSYAEISPWRKQVGINPFHKKPFRKRVKLRI